MFKNLALALLLAVGLGRAAVPSVSLPLDWTTANGISRANLNLNPIALRDGLNVAIDSLNPLLGVLTGLNGSLAIASNQDLILKVDADANGTHKLAVTANNVDSILRIHEDGTARIFDHLVVDSNITTRKVSAADSVVGAHLKTVSGNLIVGGTGAITGALSSGAFSATTGSFSDLATAAGGIRITGGTGGVGRIYYASGSDGLSIRGNTGSTNDFVLYSQDAGALLANPTGTRNLTVGHSSGTTTFPGAVSTSSTLTGNGVITGTAAGTGTSSAFLVSSTIASYGWYETDAAADTKLWDVVANGGALAFRSRTDANATGQDWLTVTRSGTTTGTATITPKLLGSDTIAAALGFRAGSAGATDAQLYRSGANMWTTPDSLTVAGRLAVTGKASVTDSVVGGHLKTVSGNLIVGGTGAITGNTTIGGTLAVTGAATFTAAPRFSSATASQFLLLDANKDLTSVAGTGSGSVVRATSPTLVTPTLGNASATTLSLGGNEIFTYDEGTLVTVTPTGFSSPPSISISWVRIGNGVTLSIFPNTETSNASTFTLTGLPASIRPSFEAYPSISPFGLIDNGAPVDRPICKITSAGVIEFGFYTGGIFTFGGFTASGTKGLDGGVIHLSYILN